MGKELVGRDNLMDCWLILFLGSQDGIVVRYVSPVQFLKKSGIKSSSLPRKQLKNLETGLKQN
jgi:hypothetical protein